MMKLLTVTLAAATLAASSGSALAQRDSFSPRPSTPRVAPVPEAARTPEQVKLLGNSRLNIFATLLHNPALYAHWSPLMRYIVNGSQLPPRHREMLMLRIGWLCQSEYEWAQHARIAAGASVGMTAEEIHRIAEGPDAAGWTPFERMLLRMAGELRYETLVSDATWRALNAEYSDQQMMEAVFTVANYQLVSMALNSLGVPIEPTLTLRLPRDLPLPALAGRPAAARLTAPRIPALGAAQWTDEQRAIIKGQVRPDGSVMNLYATLINNPRLYTPRATFGLYLQRESSLPPKTRELLIMRTGYLIRAEYEWAHHADPARQAGFSDAEIARIAEGPAAAGWSDEHRAVLQAADELRREAFVSDSTWAALAKFYDVKQLADLLFTVGGYTMTGLAINSFGIQIEPGLPRFPTR
jgi:alkylhydroperoxidase family enzyme